MTEDEIRALIIEIIQEIVPDSDLSGLDPDKPIRDQVELDSMDFLDFIMMLRKRYRITVPDDDYSKLATLNSSIAYLNPLLKGL